MENTVFNIIKKIHVRAITDWEPYSLQQFVNKYISVTSHLIVIKIRCTGLLNERFIIYMQMHMIPCHYCCCFSNRYEYNILII